MKKSLRKEYLNRRTSLPLEVVQERSRRIRQNLLDWMKGHPYREVCLFLAHRGEPDLEELGTHETPFTTALPVVSETKGEMEFYAWRSKDPLVRNRYSIMEPDPSHAKSLTPGEQTVILVPALAVDTEGHRLGFGGGYYDRYLERHPEITTMGVVFQEFFVDELPRHGHDRPLDYALTEEGVFDLS